MVGNGRSRILVNTLFVLVVAAGSFALGKYWPTHTGLSRELGVTSPSGEFITAQRASLDTLARYLQSGDPSDRRAVEEAANEAEILGTRIYDSFWTYCARGIATESLSNARRELARNPHLTLTLLRPILRQDPKEWNRGILVQEGQEVYLNLCAQVASVESDKFAHTLLKVISEEANLPCATHAKRLLEFVDSGENLRAKSEGYVKTKSWKDLLWLKDNVLCPGMSRSEIRALLGDADFTSGAFVAYQSVNDQSSPRYLWLYFLDTSLKDCDWGNAPPGALPEIRLKLAPGA
jgi:hypothetical protein